MLDDEIAVDEGKVEMKALDARRKELEAQLTTADEPPPAPGDGAHLPHQGHSAHPGAAAAREPGGSHRGPSRSRDAIALTPGASGDELGIELQGNLAAMLRATVQRKRPSESDDLSLQVALVAGARNPLNLEFVWAAA
jgi:hypothetical protein